VVVVVVASVAVVVVASGVLVAVVRIRFARFEVVIGVAVLVDVM
jgi:hypothetical protein